MIQENEIRNGNWFNHKAKWSYRNSLAIGTFKFQWESRDWYALGECTLGLDDIEPIPLTEEVLVNCGFEKSKKGILDSGWFSKTYEAFDIGDEDVDDDKVGYLHHTVDVSINIISLRANIYNITDDEQGATPKPKIKSLHQLQNLWYSLTGTELNYKP